MEVLQRELHNWFNYEIKLEIRKMPYWKLIASEKAKINLPTKVHKSFYQGIPHVGFKAKNYPLKNLIVQLWANNQGEPPFIDETGIKGNIDISLDCVLTNLDDVKKALGKYGLNLIKGEKDMKVIVIRDSKQL